MTTDLRAVRWRTLQHNHGSAGDVPGLLRRLRDQRRWRDALEELDDRLFHQGGWICPAAVAAAPFLIALAVDRATPCRAEIVELVGRIAGETRTAEQEFVDERWPAAWTDLLPALLELLDDPDPAVRCAAGVALASGSDEDRVSHALRTRWEIEDDPAARLSLVFAVGDIARARAGQARSVTDDATWLRSLVGHDDSRVGLAAAIASHWLTGGDRLPDGDIDVILASVRGSKPGSWDGVGRVPTERAALIAWTASELRSSLQAQLDVVTALADDPHEHCREGALDVAADVLTRWRSPTDSLVPVLARRLDDPRPGVRARSAHLMAALGNAAAGHADAFAALLDDSSPVDALEEVTIADIAVWGLARFKDPRCLPALCDRLAGPQLGFGAYRVHSFGAYLLELPSIDEVLALVPASVELLPALRERMRAAGGPDERRALVRALIPWGPAAHRLTPDLIALLRTDAETAEPAIDALAAIGAAASGSGSRLARLARASSAPDRVRRRAALAVFRVTGDPTLALSRWESDLDADAADACRIAAEFGRAGADHETRLRTLLASEDEWIRVEAAHALWRITNETAEAVSVLACALDTVANGTALPVTRSAARYLAAIGPHAAPAVPILRRVLADDRRHAYFGGWRAISEDEELRKYASEALGQALT